MRTFGDQGALDAPRYYSKARKGRIAEASRPARIGNDGPGLVTTQPGCPTPPAIIIAQQIKVMAVVRYRAGCAIDKFGTVTQNRADQCHAFCVRQKKRNLAADATSVRREA